MAVYSGWSACVTRREGKGTTSSWDLDSQVTLDLWRYIRILGLQSSWPLYVSPVHHTTLQNGPNENIDSGCLIPEYSCHRVVPKRAHGPRYCIVVPQAETIGTSNGFTLPCCSSAHVRKRLHSKDIFALQRSLHPRSPHIPSSGGNQNPRFAISAVDYEPTAIELWATSSMRRYFPAPPFAPPLLTRLFPPPIL